MAGIIGQERTMRQKSIVSRDGYHLSSYSDLANPPITRYSARGSRPNRKNKSWTTGFYDVIEVEDEDNSPSMVKVHYLGWHHRFDEYIKRTAVKSTALPSTLENLVINIKESLSPGRTDSKVVLRQYMTKEQFSPLECCGTLHKTTRSRTVYTVDKRQDLERLLGVGFDYRIVNEEGDSFFIDTSTIRYWLASRKPLKSFLLFPDHVEEDYLNRGTQLTFTYVKKPGNRKMFDKLLNSDLI